MPILLTSPLVIPAKHDRPAAVYGEVSITYFAVDLDGRQAVIRTAYGNTVDGAWVGAPANEVDAGQFTIENRTAHIGPGNVQVPDKLAYNVLMGTSLVPAGGEGLPVYGIVKQSLYQYLLANVSAYEGVIK